MTVSPARRAAFEVVRRVFERGAYADRAFVTAAAGLDARDRALAQRIAYGTLQRVRTLDHAVQLSCRPGGDVTKIALQAWAESLRDEAIMATASSKYTLS